jgi:hypothetical protein
MRTLHRFLRNLGAALRDKDAMLRAWVFIAGCLALLSLLGLSIWNSAWRSWLNANTVASTLLITVLLIAVGSAAFFIEDAAHKQVLEDSASSAGFAAVVDQLIDLDLALTLWLYCPTCLAAVYNSGRDATGSSKPFKWGKALRLPDSHPRELEMGGKHAAGCPDRQEDPLAKVCDEALRRLMAALRSWVDLLTRTDAGLEGVGAINRQRLALHELATDTLAREEKSVLVVEARDRARFLAVVFEAAGGVRNPRPDLATDPIQVGELRAVFPMSVDEAKELLRRLADADARWPQSRNGA